MPPKYGVIFNPNAGKKQRDRIQRLKARLEEAGSSFVILETSRERRASDLTREAIEQGSTVIVGCGGDGTINEIGSVVVQHPQIPLGLIPSGSGNDIARSQGMPLEVDAAIDRILMGKPVATDCGYANSHFFLNIASMGFDAAVVQKKSELPHFIPPHLGYYLSVFLLMFPYKELKMRITIDQEILQEPILLCAIGIGRFYGGGIEILPSAVVDDGLFEICAIQKQTTLERIRLLPTLSSGAHLRKFDSVRSYRAKQVEIETELPTYLNIDGEIIPGVGRAVFTLKEKAIRLLK